MRPLRKIKQFKHFNLVLLFFLIFFGFTPLIHAMDITLQWTPNDEPGLAGYQVFYREKDQSYDYSVPYWETVEPECTIYDLDLEKTYYFVVRAFDIEGNTSDNSNEVVLREGTPLNNVDNAVDSGGGGGGGGGCFIATAAYGSLLEPHVKLLCKFRDRYLLTNTPGKIFVKYYYKYSPPAASFIGKRAVLRAVVCVLLLPLVGFSWVILKIGAGHTMSLILLIGLGSFYLLKRIKNHRQGRSGEILLKNYV